MVVQNTSIKRVASLHRQKIIVLGDFKGKNRVNFIFQVLLEDPRDGQLSVACSTPAFGGSSWPVGTSALSRVWRRILSLPCSVIAGFDFILKARNADKVLILPANWTYFKLARVAQLLFRVKVCVDFYISASETYLDRTSETQRSSRLVRKTTRMDRSIIRYADSIIFTSEADLRLICERLSVPYPEGRVTIIPQCTEPRSKASPVTSEAFRIAWWGMVSPIHGLPVLLDAAELLLKQAFDFELKLYCLPYPEDDVNACIREISERGLEENVKLVTDVSFSNGLLEPELTTACDLALGHFAHHSIKSATILTTKVVDALSMGLPVLTRDTIVTRELIDVENELFLSAPNAAAIAAAITTIASNREERCRRAQLGRARWHETFSKESFLAKLKALLVS